MENEFKFWYEVFMTELLSKHMPLQLFELDDLWDHVNIDKEEFATSFAKSCAQLGLPSEEYDLELAFKNANTIWKEELLLNVAEWIV